MKSRRVILPFCFLTALSSCQIEPPLKLAESIPLRMSLTEMELRIETVWGIDESWRDEWWYGWDDEDILMFGKLDYPTPTNYEARFYFFGEKPAADGSYLSYSGERIWGNTFYRNMAFGWHDILFWSNIDSDEGTQVLVINENDPLNIHATTTSARLSYGVPSRSVVFNNPEIFYAGMPNTFFISRNPEDYDYYDEERNLYVMHVNANLKPLVYTYLVQIVLYNNKNRITGMPDRAVISSLADGVNVHTGHTHNTDVAVCFDMRLKHGLSARNRIEADIFGGKLTTFGLCDMEAWSQTQSRIYTGSRSDLPNQVVANFSFSNNTDSVYMFNVTDQMQRKSHGGVITIEVNVDTLRIPIGKKSGSSFNPYIEQQDSIEHEFKM